MNAKKIAVRGIIILAALVALCMFFSGTIRTIATAKVKIVQPRQGKLTQTVDLSATLVYPESNKVYIENGEGVSLDIHSVKVDAGYEVEEGDVLFEAEVAGFDEAMEQHRSAYYEAEEGLSALEEKNIRLKRTEEAWADAYEALADAREAALDASIAFRARLSIEDLELKDGALPEEASETLTGLYGRMQDADAALESAQQAMDKAERYTISEEARTYITDKIKYEKAMAAAEEDMLKLAVLNESVSEVTAPEDGYITEINVKVGETFDATGNPYAMCPKKEYPMLRCDTTDCPLNITKGMDATLTGSEGYDIESKVVAVGVTLAGGKYADVELDRGIIKDMGGLYAIASSGATVKVEYKAKRSTTLLPAAAVRGGGDERYVYTLRTQESAFGAQKTVTVKQDVTVLAESDGIVSVEEDLSYMQIAYMEDRSIAEGDSVMEYVE
jgi:multidrug efflux pump subunit AcrA (membrane-fusion protein)